MCIFQDSVQDSRPVAKEPALVQSRVSFSLSLSRNLPRSDNVWWATKLHNTRNWFYPMWMAIMFIPPAICNATFFCENGGHGCFYPVKVGTPFRRSKNVWTLRWPKRERKSARGVPSRYLRGHDFPYLSLIQYHGESGSGKDSPLFIPIHEMHWNVWETTTHR